MTRSDAADALANLARRRRQALAEARRGEPRWLLLATMAQTFAVEAVRDLRGRPRYRPLRAAVAIAEVADGPARQLRVRAVLRADATEVNPLGLFALPLASMVAGVIVRRVVRARARRAGLRFPHTVTGAVSALALVPLTTAAIRSAAARLANGGRPAADGVASEPAPPRREPLLDDRTALSIAGVLEPCATARVSFVRDAVAAGPAFADRLAALTAAGFVGDTPAWRGPFLRGPRALESISLTASGREALTGHVAALRAVRDGG